MGPQTHRGTSSPAWAGDLELQGWCHGVPPDLHPGFPQACPGLPEEQHSRMETPVPQRPRTPRGCRAARSEGPSEPGLLGGRESLQGSGGGTDSAARRDTAKAKRRGSRSFLELQQENSSTAVAWFLPPGQVQTFGPAAPRDNLCSLGPGRTVTAAPRGRAVPQPRQRVPQAREQGRDAGCGLLELCSSLGQAVLGWWDRHQHRHRQRRRSRRVHFANPLVSVRYID